MFDAQIHSDATTFAHVERTEARLRYVAVERPNLAGDSKRDTMLATLLQDAVHGERHHELSGVAAVIARSLSPEPGRYPGWAFFAGVDVGGAEVTCCVAGPHRVHLIQGGAVVASTHEHTVQYDGPPTNWPPMRDEELRSLASVVVRSIGEPAARPPEVTRWSVRGPCQVVVVSADFYSAMPAAAYALSIGAKLRSPSTISGSCALLTRG